MKKIKVMSIFGTRPEAIKMAPVIKELEKREEIESIVCVTAQHREMLDQVLQTFNITPDFDLNIMKQEQTFVDITTSALTGVDTVIKQAKPDIVLVHGDTSTAFAGALAAFYNQVAIGHVEAGLRTYKKYSPFLIKQNSLFYKTFLALIKKINLMRYKKKHIRLPLITGTIIPCP